MANLLYLSFISILLIPSSIVLYRFKVVDFNVAMMVLLLSLVIAFFTFLAATWVNFKRGRQGRSNQVRVAAYLCLIPILLILNQVVKGSKYPPIHHISTDTVNPPDFNKVIELRSEQDNSLYYDTDQLALIQQQHYPDIDTLKTELSAQNAFDKALKVAKSLKWEVVAQNSKTGYIEATVTTPLWGFKDDVVIRITTREEQTHVDLRSVSRVGVSDLGANAKRIKLFIEKFTTP